MFPVTFPGGTRLKVVRADGDDLYVDSDKGAGTVDRKDVAKVP